MSSSKDNSDVLSSTSKKTSATAKSHEKDNKSVHSGTTTATGLLSVLTQDHNHGSSSSNNNNTAGSGSIRRRRKRGNSSFQYKPTHDLYSSGMSHGQQQDAPIQIEVIPNTDFAVREAMSSPVSSHGHNNFNRNNSNDMEDEFEDDYHGDNDRSTINTGRTNRNRPSHMIDSVFGKDAVNDDAQFETATGSQRLSKSPGLSSYHRGNDGDDYEGLDDLEMDDDDFSYNSDDDNPSRSVRFQDQDGGSGSKQPVVIVRPKQIHQNPQTPTVLPKGYAPINAWARFKQKHLKEFLAEFLGTFILILLGDGCCCQSTLSQQRSLNKFNKAIEALKGSGTSSNTASEAALVSLVQDLVTPGGDGSFVTVIFGWAGAVVMGFFASGGSAISGGHLNMAVTLSNFLFRGFPANKLFAYILGQLLGGYVGGLVLFGYYNRVIKHEFPDWKTSQSVIGMFCTVPIDYLHTKDQFVSECVATMSLMLGIFSLADPYNNSSSDLFPVFLFILIMVLNTAFDLQTGAAMNFGRDFGPRAALATVGVSTDVLFESNHHYFWIPIVAPVIGAWLGVTIYDIMIFQGHESPINTPLYQKVEFVKHWFRKITNLLTFGYLEKRRRRMRRRNNIYRSNKLNNLSSDDDSDDDSGAYSIEENGQNKYYAYEDSGAGTDDSNTGSSDAQSSTRSLDFAESLNSEDNNDEFPLDDIDEAEEEEDQQQNGIFSDEKAQSDGIAEIKDPLDGENNEESAGDDTAPFSPESKKISFKNKKATKTTGKKLNPQFPLSSILTDNQAGSRPLKKTSKSEIHFVSSTKRHHRKPIPTVAE